MKTQEDIEHPHLSKSDTDDEENKEKAAEPIIEEPEESEKWEGSINLWQPSTLVADENNMVKIQIQFT